MQLGRPCPIVSQMAMPLLLCCHIKVLSDRDAVVQHPSFVHYESDDNRQDS